MLKMRTMSGERQEKTVSAICPQCGKKDDVRLMMNSYLCNRCELVFSPREAKQSLIIVRLQEEIRKLLEELDGYRKRARASCGIR
jgi:hypothetical protein